MASKVSQYELHMEFSRVLHELASRVESDISIDYRLEHVLHMMANEAEKRAQRAALRDSVPRAEDEE